MRKYNDGRGWFNCSHRHSLSARGIKNAPMSMPVLDMAMRPSCNSKYSVSYASSDDVSLYNRFQSFLHKKFTHAVGSHPDDLKHDPEVVDARHDIEKVTSWQKFRAWANKHKNVLILIGIGGVLGIIGTMSGTGTLMVNNATGEIVAVGRTTLGRVGMIGQTVLTGLGVSEEFKVIAHDVENIGNEPISLEDLKTTQKTLVFKVNRSGEPVDMAIDTADRSVTLDPEYGELKELSSPPIPKAELSTKELAVLDTAITKVKKLLKKKGQSIDFNDDNLQVVKRVGPDESAWGAHQGKLIQIDRDILKDPNKTEGVLLHESIHRIYGVHDETRELENLHIDYLGLAM